MENNEVIILELKSGRLKIPNMFKLLVPGIGILMNITLVTTYIEGVLNGTEEYIESKMRL